VNTGALLYFTERSTKWETVARIQDMQMAKLWSNDQYTMLGIRRGRKRVAVAQVGPDTQDVL
jgi:hypothetical protein